jgi:predicted phage terminase large subunit-like protein
VLTRLPSRDELTVERCRRRLSTYIREAWPIVEPATPLVYGWHIDTVSEHLEAVGRGEIKRLIINVPPRTMKSLTSCVFWPSWEWLRAPETRWLFASYAENFAHRDSLKMRRVIRSAGGSEEGTIFQRLGYQGVLSLLSDEPWELTKDQDAKSRYDNTAAGMRLATGVRGQATGEGGDRIVVDDPLSAKQARSDADREFANTWWDETMSTRFNNDRAAAVIVMQRLHEEDLTGHLLEKGGWHHLCLPAEYEPSHPFVYPERAELPSGKEIPGDPRTEEGELLDAERLGTKRLNELLRDLGSYGYAGQMQQRPAPLEGGMFKRSSWQRWETHPPFERVVASWDMRFSDSQEAASSYVVGQVWGVHGANHFLLAQIRARLSFTETLKAVQALDDFRRAPAKLIEKKANGAAVMDTLKAKIPGLIPIEPEGGKEVRAAAVEPTVEAGNVYLPETEYIPAPPGYEMTRVDDFISEHAVFPNGAHDDQVDAMSQALNWIASAPGPASSTKNHPWR